MDYFIRWCDKENIPDAGGVTHNEVVTYVKHYHQKGTGKKTTAHYLLHLKKYYDYLIGEDEAQDNPCSHIKIKGIKRRVVYNTLSMEELEKLYTGYKTEAGPETTRHRPPQHLSELSHKRNKVIHGLIVYQAVRSEELMKLQVGDVRLKEGKIFIPGARRSNERTLKLEPVQLFDLMDYIALTHASASWPSREPRSPSRNCF